MTEFGHDHDRNNERRNAWKKISEWSDSVPDDELENLWDGYADEYQDDSPVSARNRIAKLFTAVFGVALGISVMSFVVYQVAQALGFNEFSYRNAVIVTIGVAFIRYADAGVMKQVR